MSKPIEHVDIITGIQRCRRYAAEEKVRLVEQTMQPGMTVSAVARLHGVSPSLLFQWRRRMAEGGHEAIRALIERVEVHAPAEGVREPRIELIGHLAAMLRAAGGFGSGNAKSPPGIVPQSVV